VPKEGVNLFILLFANNSYYQILSIYQNLLGTEVILIGAISLGIATTQFQQHLRLDQKIFWTARLE
jgi:hypothetical protein